MKRFTIKDAGGGFIATGTINVEQSRKPSESIFKMIKGSFEAGSAFINTIEFFDIIAATAKPAVTPVAVRGALGSAIIFPAQNKINCIEVQYSIPGVTVTFTATDQLIVATENDRLAATRAIAHKIGSANNQIHDDILRAIESFLPAVPVKIDRAGYYVLTWSSNTKTVDKVRSNRQSKQWEGRSFAEDEFTPINFTHLMEAEYLGEDVREAIKAWQQIERDNSIARTEQILTEAGEAVQELRRVGQGLRRSGNAEDARGDEFEPT